MIEQFLHHIEKHTLCEKGSKILLAISGGIDSMVMLHLFKQAGFSISVAHCNFQLRGEASQADEAFVNLLCTEQNITFHSKRFDTENYARKNNISIQMAARALRYDFFKELCSANQYEWVATAHHLNDNIETVLLNLIRGTGIDGLTGIPVKQGFIIRPLLFARKHMIEAYASLHKIPWREDASNQSDYYHRNLLRNQVIPLLKKVNPGIEESFSDTLERVKGAKTLTQLSLDVFKKEAMKQNDDTLVINKHKLASFQFPSVVLWEIIKHLGFNYEVCKDAAGYHQPGKHFESETHQLTIDREDLIISVKRNAQEFSITIDKGTSFVTNDIVSLQCESINIHGFILERNAKAAQLDADKITYPLIWRNWRKGDVFQPLGMRHRKKLSDFFIDEKIALPTKQNISVLESAGQIVWVVGFRIDERFKVTEGTQTVVVFRLEP